MIQFLSMLNQNHNRIILSMLIFLILSGCNVFFETDTDLRAQYALKKLMRAQEEYRKDNSHYARTLFNIEKDDKYDISYHKGLIYMEIEAASRHFSALCIINFSATELEPGYPT